MRKLWKHTSLEFKTMSISIRDRIYFLYGLIISNVRKMPLMLLGLSLVNSWGWRSLVGSDWLPENAIWTLTLRKSWLNFSECSNMALKRRLSPIGESKLMVKSFKKWIRNKRNLHRLESDSKLKWIKCRSKSKLKLHVSWNRGDKEKLQMLGSQWLKCLKLLRSNRKFSIKIWDIYN